MQAPPPYNTVPAYGMVQPPPSGLPLQMMVPGAPPQMMMMAPPNNAPPPPAGPINIFVGELPTDLHDGYIKTLLEKCGRLSQWTRVIDPVSGKPMSFGFCQYTTISDSLSALKLLNGFNIDSKDIVVHTDKLMQIKLNAYVTACPSEMKANQDAKDNNIAIELKKLYEERSGMFGGSQNDVASWGELVASSSSSSVLDNSNPEAAARSAMIMSEIKKFREGQDAERRELDSKRKAEILAKLKREQELQASAELTATLDSIAAESTFEEEEQQQPPVAKKPRVKKEKPKQREEQPKAVVVIDDYNPQAKIKPTSIATKSTSTNNSTTARVFKVQEEEDDDLNSKTVKDVVPLDYTEEERRLGNDVHKRVADAARLVSEKATGVKDLKALIEAIPTSKDDLFAFEFSYENVPRVIESKIKNWTLKKMKEYLGESDLESVQTLVDFVCTSLSSKVSPYKILEELRPILESDAETFTKLLWRKLIFEILRASS